MLFCLFVCSFVCLFVFLFFQNGHGQKMYHLTSHLLLHKCYTQPTTHDNNGRILNTKIYTSKTHFHNCYKYFFLYHWARLHKIADQCRSIRSSERNFAEIISSWNKSHFLLNSRVWEYIYYCSLWRVNEHNYA